MRRLVKVTVKSNGFSSAQVEHIQKEGAPLPAVADDVDSLLEKYEKLSEKPCEKFIIYASFYFYEDSQEYESLKYEAQGQGLQIFEECEYVLNHEELEKTPFFLLEIDNPWRGEAVLAPDCGNIYEGGCDHCKKNGVLVGKCYVPTKKASLYDVCRLEPEIIVSKSLCEMLKKEEITGCSFEDVYDRRKKIKVDELFRMKIENTLPPMSDKTWKQTKQCDICKHEWTKLEGNSVYCADDLKGAKDFNVSIETFSRIYDFNKDTSLNYTRPYIIVSKKAREILINSRIKKSFYLQPVIIQD